MSKKGKKKKRSQKKNTVQLQNRVEGYESVPTFERRRKNVRWRNVFVFISTLLGLVKVFVEFDYSKLSNKEKQPQRMVVEHMFDFGEEKNDSIIQDRLEKYAKIEEIATHLQETNQTTEPIIDSKLNNFKGYTLSSSAPFCNSELIVSDKTFDFTLTFFNPTIVEKVSFISVKISKIEGNTSFQIVETHYKPKAQNKITISNDLKPGKYKISIGFTFTRDLASDYPTFYCSNFFKVIE